MTDRIQVNDSRLRRLEDRVDTILDKLDLNSESVSQVSSDVLEAMKQFGAASGADLVEVKARTEKLQKLHSPSKA